MTEDQLLSAVRDLCRLYQLTSYHTHRSDRSDPGFPDLVIVGPAGVLFRELKTAAGKLTADQRRWQTELHAAGADVAVWRPADLLGGGVGDQLRALRTVRKDQP